MGGQRGRHVGDQGGLHKAHHDRGGEVVLVHEIPVENGLGDTDFRSYLVHADVTALPADGAEGAVDEFVATLHLVLVPAPFAAVDLDWFGLGLLCHVSAHPFCLSDPMIMRTSPGGRIWLTEAVTVTGLCRSGAATGS